MRYSLLVPLVAALCIRATLISEDSFQSDPLGDSLSPALLADSTDVTLDNDGVPLKLDVPVDSNLSWDISDQSFLDLEDFTIAGNSNILALTCDSDNGPAKSKSQKREAALCNPDGAPQDFTNLRIPALSDIESLFQQKTTTEPDQARQIAVPGTDESDNDSCKLPYIYNVCCHGPRFLVIDAKGVVPLFMAIKECNLSESKWNRSTH